MFMLRQLLEKPLKFFWQLLKQSLKSSFFKQSFKRRLRQHVSKAYLWQGTEREETQLHQVLWTELHIGAVINSQVIPYELLLNTNHQGENPLQGYRYTNDS
jgi:cell shape-determining protein MreC